MTKNLKTYCYRIKLKKNSLEKVTNWKNELINRKEEVIETLRDEGVYIESVFLEKNNDDYYLIAYSKLEDSNKAHNVAIKSKKPIDEFHRKFKKETWEELEELPLLVDFDRINEL